MTATHCLPVIEDVTWVGVDDPTAAGRARRVATGLADRLGFPENRIAEVGIVVTELATNLDRHAEQGTLVIRSVRGTTQAAVEVVAVDRGPGIADVASAFEDGRSTAGTLGVGLGAVRRLSNAMTAFSEPGRGTIVTARFHATKTAAAELADDDAAGLTRPITSEEVCGDAYAVMRANGRMRLMMCDGSGHGPLAASASREAVRVFCERPADEPPERVVTAIHAALRGSRGGAVAVADLSPGEGRVRFAGLGNIAAAVVAGGQKKGMISVPGIAGFQARTIRAFDHALPAGAAVVLHSDGLTEKWQPDQWNALFGSSPLVIAAAVLRDAGVRNDDAGVLVGKPRP
ncbi:Anti-sigma regulatory factor (Ser/Thr protein kinase) [Amycolatopsis pretoriensis]|uniref:Anti-sigma regulatory factor (Ser/Thr protein kinase) n=1 Tax=Amycolatopsis pretoriensis TaxID=218821 RepID=A0A1H5QDW3_9PSEU|nr:ATP-binding SpoIIE family protein phosphatase [Amycolatopsis pretoriensis]SEF24236.1 Anti-sigma regulatory factor (Ser/Thr protein kinase) [Amycolatopsis pretoriensis]